MATSAVLMVKNRDASCMFPELHLELRITTVQKGITETGRSRGKSHAYWSSGCTSGTYTHLPDQWRS